MIETNQTLDSIKDMLESGNSDDELVVGKDEKLKLACCKTCYFIIVL